MGKKRNRSGKLVRFVMEVLEQRQMLSAISWTGGGDSTSWTDPNNWSSHTVPGSGDDATINTSTGTINLNGTDSARSLTTGQTLNLSGGTLSIMGGTGSPNSSLGKSFNIGSGATLNLGAGVKLIQDSVSSATTSLTVNGTLNLANGSTMALDASQSYATTQLVINGTVTASGASFAQNSSAYASSTNVAVNNGGHLVASNSSFGYSSLSLAVGAVFNSGDLANDAFNLPIYIPYTDVPLLSAAQGGADNKNFQNIFIYSTVLPSGSTLNLNAIGTVSTSSLVYQFNSGNFNIGSGATLNLGAGVKLIQDSVSSATTSLTVNGTLNLANGSTMALDASQSYATTQLVINGTVTASGASFAQNSSAYASSTNVAVNNGGHLVASNSSFGYSSLSLAVGAVFNSGDLANDAFNLPIYIPYTDVPLLSAAQGGADNKNFQNIFIYSTVLPSGSTLNLNAIGTVSTSSLVYQFNSGNFNIGSGATLNLGAGVKLIQDSVSSATTSLTVNGTLNLANGSTMALDASQSYATTQLVINGTVTASGASFAQNSSAYASSTNVAVNNGGHLVASNSSFGYSSLSLAVGAVFNSGDLANDAFNLPIYIPYTDVPLLSAAQGGADNKNFQNIFIYSTVLPSGSTLNLNAIGTVSTSSLVYQFNSGNFNIGSGATLNLGAGVKLIQDSVSSATTSLTVNGTLNLANGSTMALDASQSYATTQLVINGTVTASGASFAQNSSAYASSTNVAVNNGGHLVASNSSFGYSSLSLAVGAVFNSGDLANDAFNLPIYIPYTDVPLLSAAQGGADNKNFQNIFIYSTVLPSGSTLNLNAIGTVSTSSLVYQFNSGNFNIGSGATLNLGAGVKLIQDSVSSATTSLTVNGTLNLANGSTMALDASQSYATTQLVINGTVTASGASFAQNSSAYASSTNVAVNNGGHLVASNSSFGYSSLSLAVGAVFNSGDLANDAFNLPIYIPYTDVPLLSAAQGGADNKNFQNIFIYSTVLPSGSTLNLNAIGTVSTSSLVYQFNSGNFNIGSGATLNLGAGVKLIQDSVSSATTSLTVNGTLNLANGSTMALDASQSYATTQLVINGTVTASGASFAQNSSAYASSTNVAVNNGGHLVASNSSFGYSSLSLAVGAVFNSGDLANDAFNLPIYIPYTDVPLLSAAQGGADNKNFQNIFIYSTVLPSGSTLNLNAIGTVSTSSLVYQFNSGNFNIGSGATLNLGAGVKLIQDSVSSATTSLTVNGTLNLANGSTMALDASQSYATTQLVINGTVTASGASFAQNSSAYASSTNVAVNNGGHLIATNSSITYNQLIANTGSSISFSASQAGQTFYFGKGGSGLTLASPDLLTVQNGATVVIPESLQIGSSAIVSVSSSSSLVVNGNLLGSVQSPVAYNPLGTVTLNGSGTAASPELFEAMSANLGSDSPAFVNNFVYGTLALAGTTYVKLVDQSHNTTSTSPEAVYVNSLIVPAGTTLNLNGFQLYARYAQVAGTIVLGTGGVFTQIPASSGTLSLDYPIPGNLSQGALSTWSFYGTAGQVISAAVDPGSGLPGGPISPTLQWAQVQLVMNSSSSVLATGSDTTAGGVVALTNIQLPSTGWYHIAIQAPSSHASSTGNYVVAAYDVTPNIQSLNVGQPTVGSVATPYSYNPYTFAAAAGTQVQFVLQGESASGLTFTLTGPNGFAGFTNITGTSSLVTLPTAGMYTLTAQGNGGAIGQYAFEVVQTSLTPLTLGSPTTGTFAGNGQAQLYSVNVTTPGPLQLTLADAASADHVELYAQLGSPPTQETNGYGANGAGANQSILIPNAVAGTWYVLVYAESVANPPSNFSLDVVAREIVLGAVTPTTGASPATTTLTLTGLGFAAGTTVSLISSIGTAYAATSVNLNLNTQLTATFAPNSVPAGVYGVQVKLPDGTTDTLSNDFTMAANGQAVLTTNLELPSPMSRHIAETIYVDYANTGNVAMPAPLLILEATNPLGQEGALMTLDPSLRGEGLWTNNTPAGYSQSIEILASGATPGVLQPGESERIPVYYAGWLTSQWDFSTPTLNFALKVVQPGDQSAMNWNGATYVTGVATRTYGGHEIGTVQFGFAAAAPYVNGVPQTSSQIIAGLENGTIPTEEASQFQLGILPIGVYVFTSYALSTVDNETGIVEQPPASISQTAWNVITSNLQSTFGSTLGGYVTALDSEANYLGQLGLNVTDVQSLWGFAVQQADNALSPLSPYLASATDDSVAIPGSLSLDFSRVFGESISGRDTASTLGMGWSTPWQTTATLNSDGSVTINGPGGAQQLFEPDDRTSGVYFSQPGDTSTLSADGSGGHLLTASDGTETDYTAGGLLNFMQDTDGNRITAGYTSSKLTSLNASTGQYIHIGYNAAGLISSMSDSDGRSVTYTYDSTNTYLVSVLGYNAKTTSYSYNVTAGAAAQNALTTISFPGGTHQYFMYDSQGRVASTYSDGGAQPQAFAYNLGEVSVTDGTTDTSSVYYNQNGQVSKSVDGLGNPTYYTYDASFNLASVTNAQGQSETYTYNSAGEATASTDFLGYTTHFVYGGPDNQLTSMTDAKGNVTQYGYDASDDLLATTYADGTHSNSTFNPLGEATSFINQNGQPITYTYNTAGQVMKEGFSDGTSYAYTYDANGNLLTATDATGVTTFTYDPVTELMTQVQYPGGLYLKFAYNAAGQRTQMVDQTGFTTNYIYDANGRLSQLTDGSGNVIVTYTYDADGRLARKVNGNGTYTTYSYDADGNVLTLYNNAPGGAVNSSFVYTYNSLGLETTETTIDGEWVYGYDADGQLTHAVFMPNATDPDGLTSQNMVYNYDAMGNRTSTVINGVTTVYTINNMNRYASVGGVAYKYDADGNLLSDGTTTYTYNAFNQILTEQTSVAAIINTYNALLEKVSSSTNGVSVRYLLDAAGLSLIVGVFGSLGTSLGEYSYGLGLTSEKNGSNDFYYGFDSSGSTSTISSSSGAAIDAYTYDAFGNQLVSTTPEQNPFTFSGESGVVSTGDDRYEAGLGLYTSETGQLDSTDVAAVAGTTDADDSEDDGVVSGAVGNFAGFTGFWLNVSARSEVQAAEAFGQDFVDAATAAVEPVDSFAHAFGAISVAADIYDLYNGGTNYVGTGLDVSALLYDNPVVGALAFDYNFINYVNDHSTQIMDWGDENPWIGDQLFKVEESIQNFTSNFENAFDQISSDLNLLGDSLGDFLLRVVNVIDPNALYGPSGSGTSNFIAGSDTTYPYLIDFENSPTATAPVQYLTVTNQLDPNLNWSTFQLTGIGWGNFYLTIPAGSQSYETTVLMTENGQTFDVQVNAGIHTATGQVYATFQCIDPATGLPPSNPLTGFLPPENGTGNGSGYVSYSISPKAGLPTGTQIRNIASINFDQGVSLATDLVNDEDPSQGIDPTKQGLVTIDAGNPTSSVATLPPTENTASFNVSWGGMDDTGGSGIATYTIYVSANGTPFVPWMLNTNTTTGTFAGTPAYTYSFYSVATDNVGNVQPTPTSAQAITTVSGTAPQTLTLSGSAEYLQLDPDGTHLDVWNSTSPTGSPTQYLLSGYSSIAVNGVASGTSLTVDFSNGDPLVATGLTFSGVAGKTNTLNVIGTSGNDSVSVSGISVIESAAFGSAYIGYSNLSAITFNGGSGSDTLTQSAQPGATLSYLGTTLNDSLVVNAGTFTFPASSTTSGITPIDLGSLTIGATAKVLMAQSISHNNRNVLVLNSLSLAGNTGNWTGTLDLSDNDLVLTGGSLTTVVNQLLSGEGNGNWKGAGLTSSSAANDSTHLTALGLLLNTNSAGGPIYGGAPLPDCSTAPTRRRRRSSSSTPIMAMPIWTERWMVLITAK